MPQGVEVGHAAGRVAVGQEGRVLAFLLGLGRLDLFHPLRLRFREVLSHHLGHLVGHALEDGTPLRLRLQPRPQEVGQVAADGLHVAPPVLRVGGLHGHRGRIGVEVKGLRHEAPEFVRPEARAHGHAIQDRPVRARDTDDDGPLLGGRNQAGQFLVRERAAVVPAVQGHVVAGEVREDVFACPAVAPKPPRELLDGPERVVTGLEGKPLLADRSNGPLHHRWRELADAPGLRQPQHLVGPRPHEVRVVACDALGQERRMIVGQMAVDDFAVAVADRQRPRLGLRVLVGLDVDDALAPEHGVGFEFPGQGLGGRVVLAALHRLALPRPHLVRDVVAAALLASVDAGHVFPFLPPTDR
ncbi:MAG: hypothetical protein NTX87_20040 [Planctomycetota bacterium]|nr:hypothetical protein [Planctomycetota bacterium]